MPEQTNQFSIKLIFGFSLVLIIIIIGGIGIYLFSNNQTTTPLATVTPTTYLIPFQYRIKSIDSNNIILTGDTGEMTLPNDSTVIVVYSVNQELLALNQLQVDQKLNLDLIPGQKATIYLQK